MVTQNSLTAEDLERFKVSLQPSFEEIRKSLLPLTYVGDAYSTLLKDVSFTLSTIVNGFYKELGDSLSLIANQRNLLLSQLSPAFEMVKHQQDLLKTFQSFKLNMPVIDTSYTARILSTLGTIFDENDVINIDTSGIDESIVSGISAGDEITKDMGVSKRTLSDMTEDDLIRIIKEATTDNGKFSFMTFIKDLFADYVSDAAKIILEVVIVFFISACAGHYNDQVKTAIQDRIDDSMVVKDARKIITRYVKMSPTDQVGFLRKESYIRLGTSKTSPIAYDIKFPKNTVFTILERKSNWVKVEVIGGEFDGERGWLQESYLIKFKKMKS